MQSQSKRVLAGSLSCHIGEEVLLQGWILRLRILARTTFIVLSDRSGTVQCVAATEALKGPSLKLDDVVQIRGKPRAEPRSKQGFEVDVLNVEVLNSSAADLPFTSSSDPKDVSQEVILDHRPLSLRTEAIGETFAVQATIVRKFREFLNLQGFTEIISSKIVGGGTEGGTNLFPIQYFERTAYLAQSPQFYKEHGVAGFERVYETGHVYRAEPHATSRHLTEYYSLDLEMGFIDGPEDVMQLERELLTAIFEEINSRHEGAFKRRTLQPLPSMLNVVCWEFTECLDRLKRKHGRTDLVDDLDPEGERQLCALAKEETGIESVFVVGFPLSARPFYTHARGTHGAAQSFDLLFRGIEITTGGQRLHRRQDLEASLRARGMDAATFGAHLRMFELGMPPHGGLAIGLERLTAQCLGLANVREATLYPRDRNRLAP
jgi:nondiscriminating aspartyl-tRNA synthetase